MLAGDVNRFIKQATKLVLLINFFIISSAYAQNISVNSLSASDMLMKISEQLPNLMRLVTAVAYVMGMFFIVIGIFKLKQYGESRTMMSHEHHLKGPLVYLIVGAMLIYLPTSVQVGLTTFWTVPNPYGYLDDQDQWGTFLSACYTIVQLFGVIAFIRGLLILSQMSGHSNQPGTFGRGLTHIIGGILCLNIYQFVQVVMVTLGIQSS